MLGSRINHWFVTEPPVSAIVSKQRADLLLDAMLALKSKHENLAQQAGDGAAKRCSERALEMSKRARGDVAASHGS